MDKEASKVMGENVVAGVALDSQAAVKKALKGVALGDLVGNALAGIEVRDASAPADHKGSFYMALGESKIGFFATKQGFFKNSLGEELAQHSRADLKALEIEKGMMSTVHLIFQDGTYYIALCAKANLKNLKKIQDMLK